MNKESSFKGRDDLRIGIDRNCARKQQELTHNKAVRCKNLLKIMLKVTFVFDEHQILHVAWDLR